MMNLEITNPLEMIESNGIDYISIINLETFFQVYERIEQRRPYLMVQIVQKNSEGKVYSYWSALRTKKEAFTAFEVTTVFLEKEDFERYRIDLDEYLKNIDAFLIANELPVLKRTQQFNRFLWEELDEEKHDLMDIGEKACDIFEAWL